MSIGKLVLGTAGLGGQPYGREKRAVSNEDAVRLIQYAHECGIRRFDTAPAYGEAEERLGVALKGLEAVVYTKTNGDLNAIITSHERLQKVGQTFCLWHNYSGGPLPKWCDGASIYAADSRLTSHGTWSFSCLSGEVVQCDWNLLQPRVPVEKPRAFIARSVFLQGCLTDEAPPPPIPELAEPIDRCRRVAALLGVSLKHLALRAALQHPEITFVVIGPTTPAELDECVEIAASRPMHLIHPAVLMTSQDYTDPRKWPA